MPASRSATMNAGSVGTGRGVRACVAACASVFALSCTLASGAGLYRCPDARGAVTYAQQPCPGGETMAMPVDRATPTPRDTAAGTDVPRAAAASGHRLTAPERRRVARLRRDEPELPSEARIAAEIEIAAIREGVDANISPEDRATLDVLRVQLRAADARTRGDALARWRALHARYRSPAHPRAQPTQAAIGGGEPVPRAIPEPRLGAPVAGTRGPLAATPGAAPDTGIPSRVGPVADPATGRVLAPAGTDRLIDPMTGTMWMRSGRVYVDPASGRIIPAP